MNSKSNKVKVTLEIVAVAGIGFDDFSRTIFVGDKRCHLSKTQYRILFEIAKRTRLREPISDVLIGRVMDMNVKTVWQQMKMLREMLSGTGIPISVGVLRKVGENDKRYVVKITGQEVVSDAEKA